MRDVKTTTCKNKIIEYLRTTGWVSGMQLEDMASDWGTKSSTISRRARELANENKINRMILERRGQGRRIQAVQYASLGTFENATQANNFIRSLA